MLRYIDVNAAIYPLIIISQKSGESKLEWNKLLLQLQISQIKNFGLLHRNCGLFNLSMLLFEMVGTLP